MKHTSKQLLQAAAGLSRMVLDLHAQCDRSKLDEIEVQRLQEAAAQARMIMDDFNAYDKSEEDKAFS